MQLILKRETESNEWTQGKLYVEGEFVCWTLEDQSQEKKVMHETRIPTGTFEIKLRTFGGHHDRYSVKFPTFHKGMLWLQDVPEFKDILIHIGNTDDDSSGCILVGSDFKDGRLISSTVAYEKLYKKVIKAFDQNKKVVITVK